MDTLTKAIDIFYRAFADVAKPEQIDGCAHCIDDKQIDKLLTVPLRELSPDDLGSYASSAFLTVGDIPDYLYFLPRIFELSITNEFWWPDIEVTARAINETGLPSWSPSRHQALMDLLHAVFDHILKSGSHWRLDEWLCAIAMMSMDVRPFLAMVERNEDAVRELWKSNAECLKEGKLCNAFWEPPNHGHDYIVRWFESDLIRGILTNDRGVN